MIRAVFSLGLVLMMVFAMSGYFASFKIRQHHIRKEMKTLIKNDAPDSLKYDFYLEDIEDNPQFTWIHAKEFRYKGEMYDILERVEKDGKLLLKCIHDVKESGLFAELDRMVNFHMNGDQQQNNQKKQYNKLFHSLYAYFTDDTQLAFFDLNSQFVDSYCRNKGINSEPPSPPPPEQSFN